MIKRSLVAAAAFAAGLGVSTSAEARVGWQGTAVVTAVSDPTVCTDQGIEIGDPFIAKFLPSGISDNGTQSWFTFTGKRFQTWSIKMAARPVAGRAYSGIHVNTFGVHGVSPTGQLTSFSVSPAITETAQFLNITAQISNFFTGVGCTPTIQMSFVRKL